MITLIRVPYGKKDTPVNDREFRIDGKGPVGTVAEIQTHFPDERIHIIDSACGDDYFLNDTAVDECPNCGKKTNVPGFCDDFCYARFMNSKKVM